MARQQAKKAIKVIQQEQQPYTDQLLLTHHQVMGEGDENVTEQQIAKLKKKFLVFRPYEDPITIRPFLPPDRGYYFKLHKCDVKIVRYTLEDNGFRETPSPESKDWTLMWSCSAIKS